MNRPSFQFYPGDWTQNSNLRRCSHELKGVWIDVLCILHDQDDYGIAKWTLKEIADAVGTSVAKLKILIERGILKGADKGQDCEAFIFTPTGSGRKKKPPVTLIEAQQGPIWFSSRMVVDEYKRLVRAENGQDIPDAPNNAPKGGIGAKPNQTPDDAPSRAGASSSSPSSSSNKPSNTHGDSYGFDSNAAARVCIAIKAVYDQFNKQPTDISQSNPTLQVLINAGATVDEFRDAAMAAMQAKPTKGFAWIIGRVKGQREQAANIGNLHQGAMPANQSAADAGRSSAAKSVFKPQHIKHLTGGNNEIEVKDAA